MRQKKIWPRAVIALVAGAVLLSGCTSSADSGGGSASPSGSSATAGLPEVASPQQVIDLTLASLKGKTVRGLYLTDAAALTQSWIKRSELAFAEVGVKYDYQVSNYDAAVQAQQFQTAIDQKVNAIIVHNPDVSALASLITKAQQAGIYVIVMNLASNAQSDAFIGPNWDGMAYKLGLRVSDDCLARGKKEVAIISGFGSDSGSVLFVQGSERAFKEKGMTVVATQPGQYDPSKAAAVAQTILQQHPDLCAFTGNWDGMMLGVSKVVSDQGKSGQVGVYTTDSSVGACQAIGAGTLTAAVSYNAGTGMGDAASSLILYLMQSGRPAGSSRTAIFMPTVLIDKKNYEVPGICYDTPYDWKKQS